jgi:hypothetical protein
MCNLGMMLLVLALASDGSGVQAVSRTPSGFVILPANPEADARLQRILSVLPQRLRAMEKALKEQGIEPPLLDDIRIDLMVFADQTPVCEPKVTARLLELVLERTQRFVTTDLLLRFKAFGQAYPNSWQATLAALVQGSAAPELADIQESAKDLDEVAAQLDSVAEAGKALEVNPPLGYLMVRQALGLAEDFNVPVEALKAGVILRCHRNRLADARQYAKEAIQKIGDPKKSNWFQDFLSNPGGFNPYPAWGPSEKTPATATEGQAFPRSKR